MARHELWERDVWDISSGELSWTWTIDTEEFSGPMVAMAPDTWFRGLKSFYSAETADEMYCGEAKYWGKPEMPYNPHGPNFPPSQAFKHGHGETCDWCEPWCGGNLTAPDEDLERNAQGNYCGVSSQCDLCRICAGVDRCDGWCR